MFTYAYDRYKRLYTVSVGGNVLRTFSYDTNPHDGNYSQYSVGRLTAIQSAPINYEVYFGSPQGSTTFTDMFTYTQPSQVGGKRLRVTKVHPYLNGQNHTQTAVGDLNLGYCYNKEGICWRSRSRFGSGRGCRSSSQIHLCVWKGRKSGSSAK